MAKHIVQIKPAGYLLFVEDGETVLDSALKAGYEFPYSCGSATCGTCMGKVISGSFTYAGIEPYALDQTAQDEGFALFCSVRPTSDMVIELEDVYGPDFIPVRKAEYAIEKTETVSDSVLRTWLKPKKKKIKYRAGQYLKIITEENIPVPISIANAPNSDELIEIHIKVTDNIYAQEISEKIRAGKSLKVRGPYGNMALEEQVDLPMIMVAGGVGVAPCKALIEQALQNNPAQPIHLYWGGDSSVALYLSDWFVQLAEDNENFQYTPVVNEVEEFWQGETGLVHEAVAEHHDDLSGYQVFACGPTEMVYAAFDKFTQQGLKPQLMFSDTFECFPR